MKFFGKTKNSNFYNSEKNLTELANLFETDKGDADTASLSWGREWTEHNCMNYTLTYEKYMNMFRETPVKLLEIGVCDKRFPYASCKMWLSYFKNVDLYAVDNFWGNRIEDKWDEIEMVRSYGINFIYADQGNFCDWEDMKSELNNDFDFVVEDGSHWPNHMAISLWQSIDLVKSGGYYFMEDLQNPLTSRGKFKYDNSLLTENLLDVHKNGIFWSSFLNDKQNKDVQENFKLVELVLDTFDTNYLAVFKKL